MASESVEDIVLLKNSEDSAFLLEFGKSLGEAAIVAPATPRNRTRPRTNIYLHKAKYSLVDEELYTPFYKLQFAGTRPFVFIGFDQTTAPVVVVIERKTKEELEKVPRVQVLIRSCQLAKAGAADVWQSVFASSKVLSSPQKLKSTVRNTFRDLLWGGQMEHLEFQGDQNDLDADLVKLESSLIVAGYKFACVYCGPEQSIETEMFNNKEANPAFYRFMDFLGEKIKLKGWKGYRGDLDVNGNSTGEFSYATTFRNIEIMFHVSTLFPTNETDEQQVCKKRYIGNDVVVLIFTESDLPIIPSTFRSHFNHAFVVVKPIKGTDGKTVRYKVAVASKLGVLEHGPELPEGALFSESPEFKAWLLTKMINAQRSAMRAPGFLKSITRTRKANFTSFVEKYYTGSRPKPWKLGTRRNVISSPIPGRRLFRKKVDSTLTPVNGDPEAVRPWKKRYEMGRGADGASSSSSNSKRSKTTVVEVEELVDTPRPAGTSPLGVSPLSRSAPRPSPPDKSSPDKPASPRSPSGSPKPARAFANNPNGSQSSNSPTRGFLQTLIRRSSSKELRLDRSAGTSSASGSEDDEEDHSSDRMSPAKRRAGGLLEKMRTRSSSLLSVDRDKDKDKDKNKEKDKDKEKADSPVRGRSSSPKSSGLRDRSFSFGRSSSLQLPLFHRNSSKDKVKDDIQIIRVPEPSPLQIESTPD